MIPSNINKEHLKKAIQEIDEQGVRKGRHSSTYDLVYQGKYYPPKLVISIANRFANGNELDPNDFEGGKGTAAFDLLKKEGFEISQKNDPIKSLIDNYKKHISITHLQDERYKWELINEFNGHPDINAPDFYQEIKKINFENLMYSMGKAVINHLAKEKPEELRLLFEYLFDDSIELNERVKFFNKETKQIYQEIEGEHGHHQDERSIATYLTYHNSQKYTFYKKTYYSAYCKMLGIKEAKTYERYSHYLELINDLIENYIKPDKKLIEQVKSLIPKYYDGKNHNLLAQDMLYAELELKNKTEQMKQNIWIEKAKIKNRPHRESGKLALGNALLSPVRAKSPVKTKQGADIYKNMRNANKGDIVLHLIDNQAIVGVSIISNDKVIIGPGLTGSGGHDDETYRHILKKYRELDAPIDRTDIFTESNKNKLLAIKKQTEVFYTIKMNLREGAYLTPCNEELGQFLNSIYKNNTGKNIPYLSDVLELKDQTLEKDKEMIKELNTIYYGPPGTGKTFKYKTDIEPQFPGRIEFVTFHQSFSYEDFIEGIKPVLGDENPTIDSDIDVNSENELYDVIKQDFQSGNFALDDLDINSCKIIQKALQGLNHSKNLTHNDLLMLFKMTIGTWRLSIEGKIKSINQSSLPNKYRDILLKELKNESGMFGTGTYTINIKNSVAKQILNVLIRVNNSNNREKIFTELEALLAKNWEKMSGFGPGMLSQILYCLKPQWFPIFNTWGRDVYKKYLKVKLTTDQHHISHYMKNVGIITEFRETFFPEFDDFRYFDKIGFKDEKYKNIIKEKTKQESGEKVDDPLKPDNQNNGIQYHIVPGVFKRICKRAELDSKNDYAIFIDEINRGNIANIFGELITLIEPDKRQGQDRANTIEVTLPYSKEPFSVPDNLYIIGTMNTADRSIEALDTALRRRFSFIEMPPEITLLEGKNIDGIKLDLLLETINLRIEKLIDKDHQIGHSYFLDINSLKELKGVFRYKIMPLLQEYFYGNYNRIGLVLGKAFVKKNPPVQFADFFSDEDNLDSERNIYKIQSPKDLKTQDFINIYLDINAN